MTTPEHDLFDQLSSPTPLEPSPELSGRVMSRVHRHRRTRKTIRSIRTGLAYTVLVGLSVYTVLDRRPPPVSQRVASAHAGVEWLIETQQPEGGWKSESFGGNATYNQGVSALATLALLNAPNPVDTGSLQNAGAFLERQVQEKQVQAFSGPELYNHLLSLNTLLELESRSPEKNRRALIRRSLNELVRLQQPDGGWGYAEVNPMGYGQATQTESNSAVTWWVCHVLEKSQPLVPEVNGEALLRGESWMKALFQSPDQIAYQPNANGTASREDALYWMAARTVTALEQNRTLPAMDPDAYRDVFRSRAVSGEFSVEHVYAGQTKSGAWNRPNDRWWKAGGQIYVTAACVLSLVPQGGV